MKILLVVTGLPDQNSPGRSVFNLKYAEELQAQGFDVTFLYLRAIKPGRSFFMRSKINGIEVFEIRTVIPKVSFIKYTTPLTKLFKILLKRSEIKQKLQDIDIIHAIHRGAIELSYIISKRYNKPMISQFIGGELNVELPHLLKRKNFLKGIKHSNYLCFNSSQLEQEFLLKLKTKHKTKVLYRGVKLDDFRYNFKKSSEVNILFLGGFPGNTNSKGGLTLIETIKLINSISLSNVLNFKIGGPNSLNFKNSLDHLSNKKITTTFIGAVDKDLVKDIMSESHIVLIPSLAEGVPNILYEAMASGNMVIATDVGGISEVLKSEVTGVLIPPNDPKALKTAIINSTNRIERIEEFAKKGRLKIKKLSYDKFVDNYLDIYHKTINN